MTFRGRLQIAFAALALIPLAVLIVGVRREVDQRLTDQYAQRAQALVEGIHDDLTAESAGIGARLNALGSALENDNRFRLAAVQGHAAERPYLLDYAGQAMRITGLTMLQIQDRDGRILSSGHFRNEYDRLEPQLPRLMGSAGSGPTLVEARTPGGSFIALARMDTVRLGGRTFTLIGGTAMDSAFLARLARDGELTVALEYPGGRLASSGELAAGPAVTEALTLPYIVTTGGEDHLAAAQLLVTHSLAPLAALRRRVDAWFLAVAAATAFATVLFAWWLGGRMSRPLSALAEQTAVLDLDRLDVQFATERRDEVGRLARLLAALAERLRTGTRQLRAAERRATVGDVARQVNHDVKNGLIPIRNVVRHLSDVAERTPEDLPRVYQERRSTLEAGLGYLETLAANYARLTPRAGGGTTSLNAAVEEVAAGIGRGESVTMILESRLPPIRGDHVVLRRIVENLVSNALESLPDGHGRITITTSRTGDGVQLTVTDTGIGMTEAELDKAFEGFHTTKPGGTGLGLTIVRRLVADLGGSLQVRTSPGTGTTVAISFPNPHEP